MKQPFLAAFSFFYSNRWRVNFDAYLSAVTLCLRFSQGGLHIVYFYNLSRLNYRLTRMVELPNARWLSKRFFTFIQY